MLQLTTQTNLIQITPLVLTLRTKLFPLGIVIESIVYPFQLPVRITTKGNMKQIPNWSHFVNLAKCGISDSDRDSCLLFTRVVAEFHREMNMDPMTIFPRILSNSGLQLKQYDKTHLLVACINKSLGNNTTIIITNKVDKLFQSMV